MDIRQLRYFQRIAELGGFSRASLALHIAQPALSHQIARLEAELGHVLLHRRHNGVQMTEQGQALYIQAQRILKDIDDLPNVVNRSSEQLRGTVSVGLPQSTALQYAMPLLDEKRRRFAGVGLELFDEISGNLLRDLSSGRLDIAVVVSDQDALLANTIPLMDEELFLTSSATQDFGTRLPIVDLVTVPLALPGMHHGVRALVEAAVRAHGATLPTPAIVANSMSIMRRAVEAGTACSVMPWGAVCDEIKAGTIRATPLEPKLTRRVHVCSAKDVRLSLAGDAVRELLIEVTRRRVQSGEWQGVALL
ncbi:LysR family transcriptional regulator [Variovorax paradoxus]|nr:LysR family transcriptional regulator [Variovorax paradoxus]